MSLNGGQFLPISGLSLFSGIIRGQTLRKSEISQKDMANIRLIGYFPGLRCPDGFRRWCQSHWNDGGYTLKKHKGDWEE